MVVRTTLSHFFPLCGVDSTQGENPCQAKNMARKGKNRPDEGINRLGDTPASCTGRGGLLRSFLPQEPEVSQEGPDTTFDLVAKPTKLGERFVRSSGPRRVPERPVKPGRGGGETLPARVGFLAEGHNHVNAPPGKGPEALARVAGKVDPSLAHDGRGQRVNLGGHNAGAEHDEAVLGEAPGKALRHLAPNTITGAHEEKLLVLQASTLR